MKQVLDAFWRAAAYCLLPRVIALSLLPLVIATALIAALAWLFWAPAMAATRTLLQSWDWLAGALRWLEGLTGLAVSQALAPLLLLTLLVPLVIVLSVLLVAWMVTPAVVGVVEQRRFAQLERRKGGGAVSSVLWSLGCSAAGLGLLVLSLPLWLIPPLMLVLPPLIWGWMTCQVMAFDALAEHASADERRRLLRQHRVPLLAIGVVCGYLGAAPSLVWAASALTILFAPFLIGVSLWLYMLVFAFSSLWFTHYALAALDAQRRADGAVTLEPLRRSGPASPTPATPGLPALDATASDLGAPMRPPALPGA